MPETGLFDSATIAAVSGATDAPPPPWEISAAVVQQVTFEVQVPQGRRLLADIVTRSAPMYAKLTVVDRADSPVGPYREAVLALGCRAGMLPALYVVASDRELGGGARRHRGELELPSRRSARSNSSAATTP